MPTALRSIFQVFFEHRFFANGKLRSLRIEPSADCAAMLHRAGVIWRTRGDSLEAYGDDAVIERLRLHVAEAGAPLSLAFTVSVDDPHFAEYTAPAWPNGQVLLLDTAECVTDPDGRQLLHAAPFVTAAAFVDSADPSVQACVPPSTSATPMVLSVAITASLLDQRDAQHCTYYVCFDAATSHWKYLLFGAGGAAASVVDPDGLVAFDHFIGVTVADRQADVYLSKSGIPMREASPARFQLRASFPGGDRVLIKRLPGASLGTQFRERNNGSETLISEIFINQ